MKKILAIDAPAKFRADSATILIEEMGRSADNPSTLHASKLLQTSMTPNNPDHE